MASSDKRIRITLIVSGSFILLLVLRYFLPERSLYETGPQAIFDTLFALSSLGIVTLLAGGIGLKFIHWAKLDELGRLERVVFSLPIGYGVIAYGVMALGLVGFLQVWAILGWLILVGGITWREWSEIIIKMNGWFQEASVNFIGLSVWKKFILVVVGSIFFLYLFSALAPPIDTDGLIHHLQAPRLFLEANRLYPIPEMTFANYPSTIESLYTIGMAFGSDTFAKLVHMSYGILLILVLYSMGRRYLGTDGGWIAVAVLMGMPIIPIWASIANIDLGWTVYELLAVFAILLWSQRDDPKWLVASGIFTGLAMGSKYLAVGGLVVIGVWVLFHSRKKNFKTILTSGLVFGASALLVAAPWYIKNWLWLANPVYPYFSTAETKILWSKETFGFWDYIILPWHLYLHRDQFVASYGKVNYLSPLFLLVFIFPWFNSSKPMGWLALITLLRYVVWAIISHIRIRYMLPVFPLLSLLSASVIIYLLRIQHFKKISMVFVSGLIGGLLAGNLLFSILFIHSYSPIEVILGFESKDSYLMDHLDDYGAVRYAMTQLNPDVRVFMMWDKRAYYCDQRCLPDYSATQWVTLTQPENDVASTALRLKEMGVTHLLLGTGDAEYAIYSNAFDVNLNQVHKGALDFFYMEFLPACAKEVYKKDDGELYEFTCQ